MSHGNSLLDNLAASRGAKRQEIADSIISEGNVETLRAAFFVLGSGRLDQKADMSQANYLQWLLLKKLEEADPDFPDFVSRLDDHIKIYYALKNSPREFDETALARIYRKRLRSGAPMTNAIERHRRRFRVLATIKKVGTELSRLTEEREKKAAELRRKYRWFAHLDGLLELDRAIVEALGDKFVAMAELAELSRGKNRQPEEGRR
jgi:hypothetical protein